MNPKRSGPAIRPPAERFWEKVQKQDEGCWIWTGARKGRKGYECGYGFFYAGSGPRRVVNAHRFAYELEVGPIPDGYQLDHTCGNPPCVNPSHLEPVTDAEHKRRHRQTHCRFGHPLIDLSSGKRRCRECHARRKRERHQRRAKVNVERFWTKVVGREDPSACWVWTGGLLGHNGDGSDGYGVVSVGGRNKLAHRYSYELLVGSIPPDLQLFHLCQVRRCVNPSHLELITHAERGHRAHLVYCQRGHLMDETNAYTYPGGQGRRCRKCHAMRQRGYNEAARGRFLRGTGTEFQNAL